MPTRTTTSDPLGSRAPTSARAGLPSPTTCPRSARPGSWSRACAIPTCSSLAPSLEFSSPLPAAGTGCRSRTTLPTVPVHDMVLHPRESDLVIGTHGRGFWILDDVGIFESLSEDVLKSTSHLKPLRPATQFHRFDRGRGNLGDQFFRAPNPPDGRPLWRSSPTCRRRSFPRSRRSPGRSATSCARANRRRGFSEAPCPSVFASSTRTAWSTPMWKDRRRRPPRTRSDGSGVAPSG